MADSLPSLQECDSGLHVIHSPTVYLLGQQTLDINELQQFLATLGVHWHSDSNVPAEVLCEVAGRICYMSFERPRPGGNKAYIQRLKEAGHGSVLEHAVFNLLITGVSRSLTHELVRHRAGFSYSQLSQRYVDESTAEYVEPDIIAADPELHQIWQQAIEHSHKAYVVLANKLTEKLQNPSFADSWLGPHASATDKRKAARQAARSVLPNATETKIFVTANARALRHFIELRGSRHAEIEIRKLAVKMLEVLQKAAPHLFDDYALTLLPDGTYEVTTEYRKV
jgi:thymidylate synthase (FAD)